MASCGRPIYFSSIPNSNVEYVYMASGPADNVLTGFRTSVPDCSGTLHIYQGVQKSSYPDCSNVLALYLSGCFPASELVSIGSDTHVPIGSLKVGDKISSWNVEQKKMQYTAVTGIHKYTVNDIICFNNVMRVSSSHPLMVVEDSDNNILIPKWKVAFDVRIGDCVVGSGGKLIKVKTKSRHWHNNGAEVLNLSTDSGAPFLVGNCVVRAENAQDSIEWADTPVTEKLIA